MSIALRSGLLALAFLGIGEHALAQGAGADRVGALVAEARRSACFLAPTRPPQSQPVGVEVAVSAAQGDGAAMQRIAEAFMADPARPRQALDWLERAAIAGAVSAAADAGSFYASGRGTVQDEDTAALWWRFGATRGDLRSMACLSAAFLLGRGVNQDLAQAAQWALLREARAPGRLLLRPNAADFERALPPTTLAEARRLAREGAVPSPPPPSQARWESPADVLPSLPSLPQRPQTLAQAGPMSQVQLPPRIVGDAVETSGSAVVVGQPGILLTSAHVVDGCIALTIHAGFARLGGVEVRALHQELDLAILAVPGLSRPPLPVRAEVRVGEEVILLGYPGRGLGQEDPTVTVGHVSALGLLRQTPSMQFTAPLGVGNSGGPLLDRRGQLVGIARATAIQVQQLVERGVAPQNVNYAVAPQTVARFLADHAISLGQAQGERSVPDIAGDAMRSVVEVICHRARRAAPAPAPNLTRVGR